MNKKIVFDIDGTICSQEKDYKDALPNKRMISLLNKKYEEGYKIILNTARGFETGIDWSDITIAQLEAWGVKYHDLYFGKPAGDLYIDDKAREASTWQPEISCINTINKSWGKEYLLSLTKNYAFKRLEINAGYNISKQYHKYKHETWHIISGSGIAIINNKSYNVKAGNTFIIEPSIIHQIKAITDLVIIEASTIELDDIVRLDKEWIE